MSASILSVIMGQSASGNIAAIFAAGSQGVWYDPSDFSTMFQDDAGTVPVTAAGQSVGKMLDKSGFDNHLIQATSGNRPTLEQDPLGYYYLSFDGINDVLEAPVSFAATDEVTICSSFKCSVAGDHSVMSFGSVTSEAGSFDFGTYLGGAILYRSGVTPFGARATATVGASAVTVSATCNLSGATHAAENPTLRIASSQFTLTDYGSADTGGGNFGTYSFKLGSGLSPFDGRVYGAMIFDRILSAGNINTVEYFNNQKVGLLAPNIYSDSAVFTPATTYNYGSTFSSFDVRTDAVDFFVAITAPLFDYYPTYAAIGVYVGGVFNQQIDTTISTMKEYYISLSAGTKDVSFVNSLQTSNTGIKGSFVTSVRANAPMVKTSGVVSGCTLFYGDSITSGSDAAPITENAYVIQVRGSFAGSPRVAAESWGGRSLYEDCVDAPARAAFVAKISAYSPAVFWMAIGTNDYGLNLWTAANFGTAYAATLDVLHTAMPDLIIYCQTPIDRAVETANGLGSTTGDYRTAIATAVSTRTSYCTLVDGTTFMTLAEIPDGVHPNTAGHDLYAAAVIAVL